MRIMSICRAAVTGFLVLAIGVLARTQKPPQNVIRVDIDGLHSDRGQVLCALFSSAAYFPKKGERAVAHARSGISDRHATCVFQGVPPGMYAISAFHDENSNGRLDTNFFGIPREGVGASNHAKGRFGPPKFAAAAFPYRGGRAELEIAITYL